MAQSDARHSGERGVCTMKRGGNSTDQSIAAEKPVVYTSTAASREKKRRACRRLCAARLS